MSNRSASGPIQIYLRTSKPMGIDEINFMVLYVEPYACLSEYAALIEAFQPEISFISFWENKDDLFKWWWNAADLREDNRIL